MSETKFPFGEPVKLLVDLQGFPDGRLIQYEMWRKKAGKEEKIAEINGVVKDGKGLGWWIPEAPQIDERKDYLLLEKSVSYQTSEEKFYFIAKIDDKEVKSEDLVFVYPLEIFLEDETGKPIDGVKFTITFSDGTEESGILTDGYAKFVGAPRGKFTLELEGYEYIFERG